MSRVDRRGNADMNWTLLAPWRLVSWRARILLTLLAIGGILDLVRLLR